MSLGSWSKDLALALRGMRRSPGLAAVAVGTLGLAIGATAGLFSVVDTVLMGPLPFPDSDRLVHVAASAPGSEFPPEFGVSQEFYHQYGEESEQLESVSGYFTFTSTLRAGDRVERPNMSVHSPELFRTLGATPLLGRLPGPDDDGDVVVISHALWTTWFGADPGILGRALQVSGATRTVIGVMGPDFWFPNQRVVLWWPEVFEPEDVTLGQFGMRLVARMSPGADRAGLVAELTRLARQLPERFGGSAQYASFFDQHQPVVRPLAEELLGDVAGPLWVMLGALGIVLLIACANVANLFFVRAEHREGDMAVRRALGAGRRALVRSRMAEALVVAALAGVLAVALAWLILPLFLQAAPAEIPRLRDVEVGPSTVLFTLAASLLAALGCGLVPALRASMPNLDRLGEVGRGSMRGRHRARNALVVGQTALALVLLIGSGLLVRSFRALRAVDPGYETEDIFTFQFAPEREDLSDGPAWAGFHLAFMDRLRALPGVERVGIVENVPLNEGVSSGRWLTDATATDVDGGALASFTFAGGDYFETMGIDVVAGRPFEEADHVSSLGNVVVSRSAAELLWPGEGAVGQRVRRREWEGWETVVGVVEDVLQYGYRDTPQPMIYLPLRGRDPTMWALSSPGYVVRTPRSDRIAPEIRELVREVAPEAPMYRTYTMEGLAADSMVRLSFTMLTLGIASVMALLLGAVGLFGVLSYVVAQRRREIGLRMALGAEAGRVRAMVVAQGGRVVLLGVVVGAGVALATTSLLGTLLFGVEAFDWLTFGGMAAAMVVVGLLASYLPARRASAVDPIESLRVGGG